MASKDHSSLPGSRPQIEPIDFENQSRQSIEGLLNLLEKISPTLFDVGGWVLGGLIALNLVVIGAVIPVGGIDTPILIAAGAMASALPLNVAGLLLLRLIKDMKGIRIDELAREAFQDAKFPEIEAYLPADQDSASLFKRSSNVTLLYSAGIIIFSTTLTLSGLVAVLWHLAWWLGVILLVMVILSTVLTLAILAHSLPPDSEQEKELKKLYRKKTQQEKLK
ncbi:MAG TPA: hypothetical protein VMJ64_01330 [Anaerolineales bacterium]|nr:hypothetical protein [Anaerolineales bacterium]